MSISKHLILSNMLMLLIPFISLHFDSYSNQINILYRKQLTLQFLNQPEKQPKSLEIQKAEQISLVTRYILSHCQFDGIHLFTNEYSYQPNFAFLKGYTTLVQVVKTIIEHLLQESNLKNIKIIFSSLEIKILVLILINKIFFTLSAAKLYKISQILINQQQSQIITKLFLYNPACIFFHSVYTESIFTYLTFSSVYFFLKSEQKLNRNYILAILCSIFSVFFRTNGIFLATIFGIPIIVQIWIKITERNARQVLKLIMKGVIVLGCFLLPILWYQHFTINSLCSEINLKQDQKLKYQCSKTWPNLYNFIQKKFWSVGFLSYWKISNTVFILIGLPALIIGVEVFRNSFNLIFNSFKTKPNFVILATISLNVSFMVLYLVTVFLANIQSSTRFFSTQIPFYLILNEKITSKYVKVWIYLYLVFGSILYNIGFPWT